MPDFTLRSLRLCGSSAFYGFNAEAAQKAAC
jgi:hypothetical protein